MSGMFLMQAGDGKTVRAPFGLLYRSKVIQEMCRRSEPSLDKETRGVLPLHGIKNTEVLLKVLLWAEYHKEDEEPAWVAKTEPVTAWEMELQVHDWDKEFVREKIGFVCDIMEAADYLDILWLYKLAAYKIALYCRQIKDIPDGVRKYQQKINAMAMVDWSGVTREGALERAFPDKFMLNMGRRVQLVVINCAISYPVRPG